MSNGHLHAACAKRDRRRGKHPLRHEGSALLYRYLLFVRFMLANIVATTLLAGAYLQGWLDGILGAYLNELSLLIFVVFLYGLILCGA